MKYEHDNGDEAGIGASGLHCRSAVFFRSESGRIG